MSDIQSNPDRQPKADQKDMLNKAYQDMEIENGMQLIENYKHVYRINWRSHLLWTLAVICFILSRLWWLVPLPGSDYLPAYRTYPATFLTTFFQTIACACATRSLTVGLVKCFSKGIHPDSVVRYGETGGFGSMWSAFRHRSGLRYFFLASLVTMAILLGDALEGELQSSVTIYQRAVGMGMQNMVQCQHANLQDYQTASAAYATGGISHTLSDASPLLDAWNTSMMTSLLRTQLTPIENITLSDTNQHLSKRHYHRTTTTSSNATLAAVPVSTSTMLNTAQPAATNTLSDPIQSTTLSTAMPSSTALPAYTNSTNATMAALFVNGEQVATNNTNNATALMILMTGHTALPVTDAQANANLASIEVIRYTTSEGKEAILIYGTSNSTGPFAAGVFVSATATNYTCSGRDCQLIDPAYTLPPNNKAIADALADAIRSNAGLYGTSVAHGLPLDMINGVNVTQSGGLVDALYANANCQTPEMTLSEAMMLFTYSAAHWTWLGLLWVLLYVIIWLIGVYLIGYSEETWSRIARKGFMLPQIIRNSPAIFKSNISGEVVDEKAWLVPEQGIMILDGQAKHGYTVTEEEIPIQ
ncbi:hypothetical protein A0J61_01062 [Choanephora cucurbitarum]|uniref:Uncharacterized protein n=1 Tax=Choanephora cucurbitarum TaxID=101091 RepID=A0A1C7NP66_9FUNG|nr:hypothetical protein A0J61_01062 [Choanephora cucurbitarum]